MNYQQIISYARENRQNPTPAEERFWEHSRGKQLLGLKINRQYVISYKLNSDYTRYFIADFYCHKLRLVIDLDGRIHDYQKRYDDNRDEILNALGLNVIRFANQIVLTEWPLVVKTIGSYKLTQS